MRHESVTKAEKPALDYKGIGYLFSIAGVLLLGAKAMPEAADPWWHWPALIGGMAVSIIGFGLRYLSHLKQRRELAEKANKR